MIIRELHPEEHIEKKALDCIVYPGTERIDIRRQTPNDHVSNDKIVRLGCFDEKGKLVSTVNIIPYTMRINGHDIKTGGIGGVGSAPHVRNRGHIRKLFDTAFDYMKQNGQVFSYLYPFSHPYYRRFDYELCRTAINAEFPISALSDFTKFSLMEAYEPSHPVQPYIDIYTDFIRDRNLAIVRSEDDWKEFLDRDPYLKNEHTYLHYDENGNADAYVLYAMTDSGGYFDVQIKELVWLTPLALRRTLGFLHGLSAEAQNIKWSLPTDIDIQSLLPEPYDINFSMKHGGMACLVDIKAMLKTLTPPHGNGSVVINITSQSYKISWDNGKLTVENTTESPDLTTSAKTLVQLITGYITPEKAIYKPDTVISHKYAELKTLFPLKKSHLTEAF